MYHVHFSNQLAYFCWSLNVRFHQIAMKIFFFASSTNRMFLLKWGSSLYVYCILKKTQENMERLFAKCNTESENNSQPHEPNRSRNLLVSCLSFEMDALFLWNLIYVNLHVQSQFEDALFALQTTLLENTVSYNDSPNRPMLWQVRCNGKKGMPCHVRRTVTRQQLRRVRQGLDYHQ